MTLVPYAQAEVFYDTGFGAWNRQLDQAGVELEITKHWRIEPYYAREEDLRSSTAQVDRIGLVLKTLLVALEEHRSGPCWRRHWHVDHTAACVACRVPSRAALVVRHAAHGDGGDVARWGDGCGRRCWCVCRRRCGGRGDSCRRGWRARNGGHRTDDDCPSHEAGSCVVVVPVPAAVVAIVLYVGYGR